MSDIIFKIRVLYLLLVDTYHNWKGEVWERDLDERYCCDGSMCMCGGDTIRDIYK